VHPTDTTSSKVEGAGDFIHSDRTGRVEYIQLEEAAPEPSHRLFCRYEKCPHYGAVIAPMTRKCRYGPQCWRGELDIILSIFRRHRA
jgi:hypothetical protein